MHSWRPPVGKGRIEALFAAARRVGGGTAEQATGIDALYFTGGSTGLPSLVAQLAAAFPSARPVRGDRYASVVSGLALTAQRRFGTTGGASC